MQKFSDQIRSVEIWDRPVRSRPVQLKFRTNCGVWCLMVDGWWLIFDMWYVICDTSYVRSTKCADSTSYIAHMTAHDVEFYFTIRFVCSEYCSTRTTNFLSTKFTVRTKCTYWDSDGQSSPTPPPYYRKSQRRVWWPQLVPPHTADLRKTTKIISVVNASSTMSRTWVGLVEWKKEIESGWCDLIAKMEFSNNQLETTNRSRQKVLRYFPDLGSVSNSTNQQELIDLWSRLWSRNWVRVVPPCFLA